jgi:hypothetical protein
VWKGKPPGFIEAVKTIGTVDMTTLTIESHDFKHALVGSHSWWKGLNNAGILETKDGGDTFIIHPPVAAWPGGSIGIQFLYDPRQAGRRQHLDGEHRRHAQLLANDRRRCALDQSPGRSQRPTRRKRTSTTRRTVRYLLRRGPVPAAKHDNGINWQPIQSGGLPYSQLHGHRRRRHFLYTAPSCACNGSPYNTPYLVSPKATVSPGRPKETGTQKFR